MPGSLSTYWKKRDFGITSEPRGEVAPRKGKQLSFVVQKHAARRLHYDFRLELQGTLKSWAIPKGPSFDPKIRRMAVHTEDHPMSYANFEGVIPAGQYGAGTVIVWDRGTWEPVEDPVQGYRKGKLKFDLHGEKLHGRWNLIRINSRADERQEPWLLIKESDEEARPASEYDVTEASPDSVLSKPKKAKTAKRTAKKSAAKSSRDPGVPSAAVKAPLPVAFFPMLATLVDEPPRSGDWIYEIKLDGYRVVARIDGDDVRVFTRNGNDWTSKLKPVRDEIRKLGIVSAWLDGEIAVMDPKGNPSFQLLQRAIDNARSGDIVFFAFDMPHFGGYDLTAVPLTQRKLLLQKVLEGRESERVRFSEAFDAPVEQLLEGACKKGLEGLIGKRAGSTYVSKRSNAWIKLKCSQRQEFIVIGYTDPKGTRTAFGSLLLGLHDEKQELVYAGSVGTGFDEHLLLTIHDKLKPLRTDKAPIVVPRGVKGHWVQPKLIAEVAFTEWTEDGRVRHPVFHGLRTDKDPEAISREKVVDDAELEKPRAAAKPGKKVRIASIDISHPERVIDKRSGAAKLDLVKYYESIADLMLPHLVGRPIALVRAPTGIEGELFFQKHGEKIKIPGIRQLDRSFWPGHPAMLEIATGETLVGAAQMNVIEIHTWNSTTDDIAHPDRVIFDLDPGKGIDFETLKEGTTLTRKMLDLLGLESFLKTSGGKGLHVVVPLTPSRKWGYDEVKDFAEDMVKHMAATIPKLFVSKSGESNRVGRIFVDYLRNGKGATTICAFSARARPGLGVSVPLTWRELPKLISSDQWNIFNVQERLKKLRADPWKDYSTTKQTLDDAAARLGAKT